MRFCPAISAAAEIRKTLSGEVKSIHRQICGFLSNAVRKKKEQKNSYAD